MARAVRGTRPDRSEAKRILSDLWDTVLKDDHLEPPEIIRQIVNADEVGMRFCLPTQLLGKLTDNSLDALIMQTRADPPGNWNARTFASNVIVPWNRANQRVLGSSSDPYVSNPLRRPRLDFQPEQLDDPAKWEVVCDILREIQERSDPGYTRTILMQVLAAIRDRLRSLDFTYVVPNRISLQQVEAIIEGFLSERSGGDRGLAVAAAFFETIRERFGIYREIRRGAINAADAATRSAADLECIGPNGNVVLAVEVKERRIGDDDLHIAIAKARELEIRELILCSEGITAPQREQVLTTIQNAWASGTNVYQTTTRKLICDVLPITGEIGIKAFIVNVGEQLDKFDTQPRHRQAWKALLDSL